jgi:DNA-binding NarL/FixJ family response regulator
MQSIAEERSCRVFLVDDHRMMRDGLRAILDKSGHQTVGEAGSGREALTLAQQADPQVVIMDISMPGLNGVDATQRLLAELPRVKVIALSMSADRRYVLAMFAAGARGYLLKNSAADELLQAIRTVMDGLTYVSPSIAATVVDSSLVAASSRANQRLSVREREVLQLIAEGLSSKAIATQLTVAVSTVDTHRRQIMEKLNLHTVAQLTKYAIREGLTSIE